jgi:L-aspartate oxidase
MNEPPAYGNRGEVADRQELAQAMSRYAGVMRDAEGLTELLRLISAPPGSIAQQAATGAAESTDAPLDLEEVEAANLRTVSLLIAAGALRRAESRGCHRRRDATGTAVAPWHTLARWDGQRLVISEGAL